MKIHENIKNNRYLKHKSSWVLYILGLLAFVPSLVHAIIITYVYVSNEADFAEAQMFLSFFLVLSAWWIAAAIATSVFLGVSWIIHKNDARYSLLVGFLIAFLSFLMLINILGLINSLFMYAANEF